LKERSSKVKKFDNPEMEIQLFQVEDVITASGEDIVPPGQDETPPW